jgi:hypothetical protein
MEISEPPGDGHTAYSVFVPYGAGGLAVAEHNSLKSLASRRGFEPLLPP